MSPCWTKKYQLCLLYSDGKLEFTEYKFDYMTSATNFNQTENSGYVAVVDGPAINLTPLGKFVMPPPMFDSQVSLPYVPKAVSLWGHYGVAYIDNTQSLYVFNCESAAEPARVFSLSQILAEHDKDATVSQVMNLSADQVVVVVSLASGDTLLMIKLQGEGAVEVVA